MHLPAIGDLFEGRYRIEAVLGEGGFARVYAATSDGVKREVAIKVLKPHDTDGYDPTTVARFLQEARVMSQLRDPHTITMFDCGRSEDGLLFMVCELLPGEDLSELLARRGRLTEDEVVRVLRQVLLSLREAHSMGLLHRDIKPGNIRVFEYMGDPFTVKVLDFGIAKSADLQSQLTATGRVIGTPRYMSPEQLRGEELTAASDLYSVGLVAHEMLLGHSEREELVSRVVVKPADLVSAPLRSIVNRMLEPARAGRFQSAQDVLDALDGSTTQEPVPQPHSGGGATVRDLPRRPGTQIERRVGTTVDEVRPGRDSRGVWASAAALAVVVLASLVAFLWLQSRSDDLGGRQVYSRPDRPVIAPITSATNGVDRGGLVRTHEQASQREPDLGRPTLEPASNCPDRDVSFAGEVGTKRFYDGLDRVGITAYVARTYDPEEQSPLILAWGDKTERRLMLADPQLQAAADELRAIVVSIALEDLNLGKGSDEERQRRVTTTIRSAIQVADKAFCLDREHVFAIGTEHDARRLVEYRCSLPIAAIVTTGANVEPVSCAPDPEVPHLHLHAEEDLTTPRSPEPRDKRTCTSSFDPAFDEMVSAMDTVYGCNADTPDTELLPGCKLRQCERGPVGLCSIDGGRIFQQNLVSRCKGPRPTTPRHGELIAAFFARQMQEDETP